MKGVLIFFLLQSSNILAQNYYPIQKTQLNKFVEEKAIEWAIYKNDTLITKNPDLKMKLISKVLANKIKAFGYVDYGSNNEDKVSYLSQEQCASVIYGIELAQPPFDSLGNITELVKQYKRDVSDPKGEVRYYQILYIKKGKLFSHINWISPIVNITTSQGIDLGKGEIFSTALNTNYDKYSSKKDKIIFLKKTNTEFYVDSIKKDNKLKEIYGHNLIETLWPYVKSGKIKCFTEPENKATTIKEIENDNLLNLQTIHIPLYDSMGMLAGTKLITTDIKAAIFDKISISQEWYYNETKNIVFCKIPFAMITVMKNYSSEGDDKSLRQIKLVF